MQRTDPGPSSVLRDPARLAALRRLDLSSASSAAFDRLARLAAAYLGAPVALVSLVEEEEQSVVGVSGLPEPYAATRRIPGAYAYCRTVVEEGAPLAIEDAREHPLFHDHPALLELGGVSYLGVPLVTADGHTLGAFCALDTRPRQWAPEHLDFLRDLGASVMTEIGLRQELLERAAAERHYRRLVTTAPQAVYVLDVQGRFAEVNPAAEQILDRTGAELLGTAYADVVAPRDLPAVGALFLDLVTGRQDGVFFEAHIRRPSGEERLLSLSAASIREDGQITGLHGIAQDVTEERAVQRALAESEERFREIADNVREAFWSYAPDFSRPLYVSPGAVEIWGMPVDEWYRNPRGFLALVHPDDRQGVIAGMERIAGEPVEAVEFRVRRADGSERWLRVRGYPVRDESGTVVRVVGTTADITDRKHVEQELRESEERFRQLAENIHAVFWLFDVREQRTIYCNPAFETVWGRPGEHTLRDRATWLATIHPDDRERVVRSLDAHPHGGVSIEYRIVRPDGRERWIHDRSFPVPDAHGTVYRTAGIAEDVTERREQEARMRLLHLVLERSEQAITILNQEREFIFVNAAAQRLFGMEPGGRYRLADVLPSGEMQPRDREINDAILQTGAWSGRVQRRRCDDGSLILVDAILGSVVNSDGERLYFTIHQDATEAVTREQQLRRAERLASLGTLIGGVAHELNNPLGAVLNFAQLMLMDERRAEDREALGIIQRESERMAKIVSDLKQLARSAQESQREKTAVDLNEVVRHVLKVQQYRLRTSNVEVQEDLSDSVPRVLGDRAELEQVVLNLVVNAEQAMAGDRGEGRLVLRTRASAKGASLHVVDSGPGIPPHQLERIWDPFWTTKSPGDGTGLGLALVHSIVAEHGGEIRVDSQLGSGTAFRVELPRADRVRPAPARPAAAEAAHRLRVLVVDDEPSVRLVMTRFLEHRGHQVEQAAEGGVALEMLEAGGYDVVLSDLRMPGLGGEEMMERLRERGHRQRVVFMTGDANEAGARLERAGASVLLKPVDLAEVARAVEGAAARPAPLP